MRFRRTCAKCGGKMVYEEICEYGQKHFITTTGAVSKKYQKEDYGGTDIKMFYCDNCGWSPYEGGYID